MIWYLRDYLWFVLVSPLALWLFRRAPLPTLIAPYLLLVVVESGFPTAPAVLRDFGLYFGAWLLGFAHHDGMLRRLGWRLLTPVVVGLATVGGAWILTHPGPRGYDLNDIRIGNALWAAAFILILLGLAPAGAAWVDRNARFGRLVTIVNRRALTIYLWHMSFVVLLTPLVDVFGWSHTDLFGLAVRVVAVFVLVGLVTLLVGWVEDVAAGRPPELIPGGTRRRPVEDVVADVARAGVVSASRAPVGAVPMQRVPAGVDPKQASTARPGPETGQENALAPRRGAQ